jgi:micrococcal nuclease
VGGNRYLQRKAMRMLGGLVLAAVVALVAHFYKKPPEEPRRPPAPQTEKPIGQDAAPPKLNTATMRRIIVRRVIDGDTLLTDAEERIRLIGIDTPETVHPNKPVQAFGKAASAYTKKQAEGKTMYLEFDQTPTDKYGRTLAFAYFDDGRLLNAEILRCGYAHAYVQYPHRYLNYFRMLEKQAREQRVGLWADDPAPTQ